MKQKTKTAQRSSARFDKKHCHIRLMKTNPTCVNYTPNLKCNEKLPTKKNFRFSCTKASNKCMKLFKTASNVFYICLKSGFNSIKA